MKLAIIKEHAHKFVLAYMVISDDTRWMAITGWAKMFPCASGTIPSEGSECFLARMLWLKRTPWIQVISAQPINFLTSAPVN